MRTYDDFALHVLTGCSGCDECTTFALEHSDLFERGLLMASARVQADHVKSWARDYPDVCVYCGDFSTDADHLLPEPWTGVAARKLVPTVPACGDCNSRIGDLPNPDIQYRASIAMDSLRRKNQRILTRHKDNDYSDLEGNLRRSVEAARFRWLNLLGRMKVLAVGGFDNLPEYQKQLVLENGIEVLAIED